MTQTVHLLAAPGSGKTRLINKYNLNTIEYSKFQYARLYLIYWIYFFLGLKEFKAINRKIIFLKIDLFFLKNLIRSLVKENLQKKYSNNDYVVPDESYLHLIICICIFNKFNLEDIINFKNLNRNRLLIYTINISPDLNLQYLNSKSYNETWKGLVFETNDKIISSYNETFELFLKKIKDPINFDFSIFENFK